jgi:tetratricopeptide (TPR) repeat protein
MKIISGPEWYPLQVQEGVSAKRRKDNFARQIQEFNGAVYFTHLRLPVEETFVVYRFNEYYVHVHESVLDRFNVKFAPFLVDDKLYYDNLINICIMVKNAGEGFRDILTKNLPYMDQYTILDTGSTDNTVQIAREVLAGKRGTIYQEPFINFRDSRNRLLDLAGTNCFFNVMLDDTYVITGSTSGIGNLREFLDFARGDDGVDSYSITVEDTDTMYMSNRVTKSDKKLRYTNLVHEVIQAENNHNVAIPYRIAHIQDVNSSYMQERSKIRKQQDIDTLMKMLEDDPDNARTYYYLAETYIGLQDWENALHWFMKRVRFAGYHGEYQDALYYIAVIKDLYLHHPWEECLDWYLQCYEANPSRSEALYFIGDHYNKAGRKNTAFMYWKHAYNLGMPDIQMSVRKHIYNFHIPKSLALLCYEFGEYKLGEEASAKALRWNSDDSLMKKWHQIFYHINEYTALPQQTMTRSSRNKVIAFVSPGGWSQWDGETLYTKGLGGSENFTVRYAEELVHLGYNVLVFCDCAAQKTYNGVVYIPLGRYLQTLRTICVDVAIINRYPEYIPVTCMTGIKTYFVAHDIAVRDEIIVLHPLLMKIFCLSEWHKSQFLQYFGTCESYMDIVSYGINTNEFPVAPKERYMFIYPNFPNRGLLQLLQMWPHITAKYSTAKLHIFCDTGNTWCQKYWADDMRRIDELLIRYSDTVTNHGWVNGETLRSFWARAHVWLYPCTFEETCCLTAWEAAASNTLVVTNHMAALKESVGDRGVVVCGDSKQPEWRSDAMASLFEVLDNEAEHEYTRKNFQWIQTKSISSVVKDFCVKIDTKS